MAVAFSIPLVLIGLAGPLAATQWRQGEWLSAARWIQAYVSPPAVVATPVLGVLVMFAGLMMVWPPAVLLAFLTSLGLLLVLGASARDGMVERVFPALGGDQHRRHRRRVATQAQPKTG